MGRSDPDVHRAECELWEKMGQAEFGKRRPFEEPYRTAEAACERAVNSSSKDGKARVQRAVTLCGELFAAADAVVPATEETLRKADEAIRAAQDSAKQTPDDVMAHYTVALALTLKTRISLNLERPTSMDEAIKAYERVLEMDPRFTWALSELGDACLAQARHDLERGLDSAALLGRAIRQFDQAVAVDPKFSLAAGRRLVAYRLLLQDQIDRGKDAGDTLRALFDAVAELQKTSTGPWLVAYWRARAFRLRASYELAFGRDPRASIASAIEAIHAFAGPSPEDYWFLLELTECRLIEVAYALGEGRDAEPALQEAKSSIERAAKSHQKAPSELLVLMARVDISTLRWGKKRGDLEPELFEAALDHVRPLLGDAADASAYLLKAEIHALRAEWRSKKGLDAAEDVGAGLAMVDKALANHPHLARALLLKAELSLTRARAARGGDERASAGRKAKEAFEAAFRENPLLEKPHTALAKEAESLLR